MAGVLGPDAEVIMWRLVHPDVSPPAYACPSYCCWQIQSLLDASKQGCVILGISSFSQSSIAQG